MIKTLHISNYALIAGMDVEFAPGFNIITGETGAGKSIILGALSLIMGDRANMAAVRDAARKTVVEATFDIADAPQVAKALAENDIDEFDRECILRRELTAKGGSRAFINDTPVTLPILRSVALQLVDIHSQHQNLLLAEPWYQLSVIDALADNAELLDKYSSLYEAYRKSVLRFRKAQETVVKTRNEVEYLSFQTQLLDELDLKPGEQAELEAQSTYLLNVNRIREGLGTAENALTGDTDVSTSLARATEALNSVSDVYPECKDLADRLRTLRIEAQDIAESVADIAKKVNGDTESLDDVEERLGKIYGLQSRFHVDTDTALIKIRKDLHAKLALIDDSDATLAELENQARAAKRDALAYAREISERRKITAERFATELRSRAMPLGMHNLRVEIVLTQNKLTASGIDNIDYLFAFNKNQPLLPLAKTASGGETSRLVLAVKSIMAEKMHLPTIIFDEVDTGVSGDIANRMADLMEEIAQRSQVVTITHLSQVAARGTRHFKVYKEDDAETTNTHLRVLDNEERLAEMALMISGNANDKAARATAKQLIDNKKA